MEEEKSGSTLKQAWRSGRRMQNIGKTTFSLFQNMTDPKENFMEESNIIFELKVSLLISMDEGKE